VNVVERLVNVVELLANVAELLANVFLELSTKILRERGHNGRSWNYFIVKTTDLIA
jgi:hypothetical protein